MFRRVTSLAVLIAAAAAAPLSAQVDRTPNLGTTVPANQWSTDRFTPCQFSTADGVHGRDGVLQAGVCGKDQQPEPDQHFYNTQGEKIGIDPVGTASPASQKLVLDLWVNGSWASSTNGLVSTGMWSRVDLVNPDPLANPEAEAWYPILGFSNTGDVGAFRYFDSNLGVYVNLAATVNYDAWNTLEIDYTGNVFTAVVNGVAEYTETADEGVTRLSDAFVNTSNFGSDYTTDWSNDQPTAAPEPASLVLLGTGLLGIGGVAVRRRRK